MSLVSQSENDIVFIDANLNRKFVQFYFSMSLFSGGSTGVVLAFDSIPFDNFPSYFVLFSEGLLDVTSFILMESNDDDETIF